MSAYRLGVDIGGTFTDLVIIDESTGALHHVKLSSTPVDPSVGFINVVERAFSETGISPSSLSYTVHGTTVATNTIIEGKGAKAALIATAGFRDVFEIARQIRPKLYDIFCEKPKPIIPRFLCFEVAERLNYDGQIVQPLDEGSVRQVIAQIRKEKVEAIVVCLLHSYANAVHEKRVAEIIRQEMPDVCLSLSSNLCPEMREYFRASTTAINTVLMPIVGRYLEQLESRLTQGGVTTGLHLMTSGGGIISSQVARYEPVHLIESGPAAGAIAASYLGSLIKIKDLISFDMGGTTAKASLIENGSPKIAPHFEVGSAAVAENKGAGYPVRTPMVDLVEIGAGGGSIAWVDPGGALRVGPKSGGADPGPACYGHGGKEPTVTDANLILGRLDPNFFLGGEFKLHPELAEKAMRELARKLGAANVREDLVEIANGVIEIANAHMVGAIRLVSIQRGFDPRKFVLVAYGGAGPLHANALARELSIPKVLIPMSPGVTSALGLLVSDIKHDFVRAHTTNNQAVDFPGINQHFRVLEDKGREILTSEGVKEEDIKYRRTLDMRYVGQSYELGIEFPRDEVRSGSERELNSSFFNEHERAYGYATDEEPTEIVNLRLTAIGTIRHPKLRQLERGEADSSAALKCERSVYFAEFHNRVPCKIYDRYKLLWGNSINGPAIVEEADSTTVIHPSYRGEVDQFGNILIQESRE